METGRAGEALAETWLKEKGFTILERNWRHAPYEIDIIALKNGIPHFIEVKTRTSGKFGHPESRVNRKKIRDLLYAAEQYLYKNPQYKNFHIDILSIIMPMQGKTKYFLIEDIYL